MFLKIGGGQISAKDQSIMSKQYNIAPKFKEMLCLEKILREVALLAFWASRIFVTASFAVSSFASTIATR